MRRRQSTAPEIPRPTRAETLLQAARRTYMTRWATMFKSIDAYPYKDAELQGYQIEQLEAELERLEWDLDWVKHTISERQAALRKREKIRQLREGINGRTPAEIETARRLADRLEAKSQGNGPRE